MLLREGQPKKQSSIAYWFVALKMKRELLEKFMCREMKSRITQYPVFEEVICESLAAIHELLESTKREYILFAYVRKTEDRFHENVLHIQMHFKNPQERDTLWNRASEKLAENIEKGIKKTTDENERLEIENILCAVRSER